MDLAARPEKRRVTSSKVSKFRPHPTPRIRRPCGVDDNLSPPTSYVHTTRQGSKLPDRSIIACFFESVEECVDGDIYTHGLCTGVGTRPGTRLGAFVDHQPPTMTSRRTLPGEVAAPRILAAPPSMVAKVFWSTSGCTNVLYRSIAHLFCSIVAAERAKAQCTHSFEQYTVVAVESFFSALH